MSQSLQNQMTLAKSMNSIITLDDGAGTTITNGTINSNNITGNTITGNTLTTTNLDLNSSLTLEQYNDISVTNTGGTYQVSLWEKGRSYFQQDVHANRMYSYNSLPVGVYEVANKQYVDRKTPSFATYSTSTLLPNSTDAPTMIQLNYIGYMYLTLPNVNTQHIGREYTVYLGYPLKTDSEVISVTGRTASQLIQRKDGSITYLVDFNHNGVISYTFVCVSITPSTTQACWMISNANYELENVFLNNRMANQFNENFVENNWHKLNYFDRPEAEGSAIGLAIGSIFQLDGNIVTSGQTLTPQDLSFPASSRQKLTLVGTYSALNLTFDDCGLLGIDDLLPVQFTQIYLPTIINTNDLGKHFSFYLRGGTGLQYEILTSGGQTITYLNQTLLTNVFMNSTGTFTNIVTFYAITEFGLDGNWFMTENQVNIPLSDNTFSGTNTFSGQMNIQNTINANSLTVSPQQLSFLSQVTPSNQIPSTAISGAGFLTETSNPNITGIFTYATNPVFNVGAININAINANLCTTDTTQVISGSKTITGTITANSLSITPVQLSFLNQVATNKIPVTAVNANLCTTDTTQVISGSKTITGTITANSLSITPVQLSFLNQVATNKIPVTAVNANLCTTDTSQTISGAKTVSGVFNFTTNPTWLSSAIPITALQDCTSQFPSSARALTGFGYLCLNAHRTTIPTTGIHNTGFGTSCMQNNSSGNYNSAYGSSCAVSLDAGSNNSFFGYATASVNTGSGNSIFGANSCTTQASLTGCSLFGENNEVTSGLSNCFALGNNNSISATNAGAIGNSLTVSTPNRVQLGSGTQEVFIPGLLVINNQYASTSPTPITANITIPNLLNYQVYALKNTVNISVVLPTATSGRLSQTFLFRRVSGALTTTVVTFTSSSGSVMFGTTSVTPAASFTLASGIFRTQIVCMYDGVQFGWYQII